MLVNKMEQLFANKQKHRALSQIMGRVVIHLHGKTKNKSLRNAIEEYGARLSSKSIKIEEHSDKLSAQDYVAKIESQGDLILLDENGVQHSSVEFSKEISKAQLKASDTHLLIGPAEGWEGIERANYRRISLSRLTMPHELASLVLVEQVYRACEIIRGSSYHKQ